MGQIEAHLEDETNFDQTKKYGLKLLVTLMLYNIKLIYLTLYFLLSCKSHW